MHNIKKTIVDYPYLTKPLTLLERENGHRIVLAYKEGELVNISTWVNTGSINEDDRINGISHFVEHVMFKGTKNHKAGYFDRFLEGRGGIVNAATWKDYTFYYVTMPRGENCENLHDLIELHADMMLNPVFPDDELGLPFDIEKDVPETKRERHVVIEEINMRNDQPWSRVYNIMNDAMYKEHPYKRDVIGTPQIISSISRDTIFEYYNRFYTPKNMTTIVVGDFDEEDIVKRLTAAFDFEGRESYPETEYKLDEQPQEQKIITEEEEQISTGFMMAGYIGALAKDLKEDIILNMLNYILGSGQSSRLYQNLIEKAQQPIFNIVSSDYYQFKDGGNFLIQANFKPEYKDEALNDIFEQVDSIIRDGVSEKEFKKAKNKIKSMFAQNAETVSDIADNIGQYSVVCKDISLANEYLKLLDSVEIKDLQTIAEKYLAKNHSTVAILVPKK